MKSSMDPNSIVPLYAQIVDQLKHDIEAGMFHRTGRLPTEVELAKQYNVSRITVRRAVDELVIQGMVKKKQGKGTFVCAPKMTRRLDGPVSFTEMCANNGLVASARILEAGICYPEYTYVREELGLTESETAVRIRRLRYAGDNPLVLEDNFFPIEYSYLLSIDLEHDSIYRYLREEMEIELQRTEMRLRIIRADSKLAKLLQVSRDTPQLEMRGRVVRQQDGKTVHTSYQVGYGEEFEFIIR